MFEKKSINDYCAIFVGDETGFLAADYAKKAGWTGSIFSFDLLPENIAAIKEGYLDGVISQRSEQQISIGINSLVRAIISKDFPTEDFHMPLILVTKDNLDEFEVALEKSVFLPF